MIKSLTALSLLIIINLTGYAQPCTGQPAGGTTVSNLTSACANDTIILSVNNAATGDGLTFQWQWSADSTNWLSITNAEDDSLITTQDSTRFYRRMITCTGLDSFSVPVKVNSKPLLQCYCKPVSNCTQNDAIRKVVFGTINNSSFCSSNGYFDYSGTISPAAVNQASAIPIAVTVSAGGTEFVSLWIDYNQDGVFGPDEYTSVGFGNGVTINGNVFIPEGIPTGLTKMRIRLKYNSNLNNTEACSSYSYGETEDYLVNILPAPPCSGVPNGGTASASDVTVCSIDSVHLTISGGTTGFSGLTYQWQQSPDTANWQDIPDYNSVSAAIVQTTSAYYRRITACGSLVGYSVPVMVMMKDNNLCYCRPSNSQCNTTATITSVRISSLHNSGNCSPLGYGDYSDMPPTPLQRNAILPISISAGSLDNGLINYFGLWIDYDHNGSFDSSEYTNLGSLQGTGTLHTTITIPSYVITGVTGMRIRSRYNTAINPVNSCTSFPVGETEDYLVDITTACTVNIWTGLGGDNNWENSANWSCGEIPNETTTVVINNVVVLLNSNASIYSLILNPGANLQVQPSVNLTVLH